MRNLYAGLDVSLATTAICVVDGEGETVFECAVDTSPDAIVAAVNTYRQDLRRVGLETGAASNWLYNQLLERSLPAVCLDAGKTRAALATEINKTDRIDARGIARLLALGFRGQVHVKSEECRRVRALLNCRRLLKHRMLDLQRLIRSTMVEFRGPDEDSGVDVHGCLGIALKTLRHSHKVLSNDVEKLDLLVKQIAMDDPLCRRFMTVPGVGPITAVTFKAAIDDPSRFASSRTVGAHFGLTPAARRSGGRGRDIGISRRGDATVRTMLYSAAFVIVTRCKQDTPLVIWGRRLRARKGLKCACVACARRVAVILHRMWVTNTDYNPDRVC